MRRDSIWAIDQNIHGAWVIYGQIGVRQYYYMTKGAAMARYKEECAKTIFTNEKRLVKQ